MLDKLPKIDEYGPMNSRLLKEWLKSNNLSRTKLAARLDISAATMQKILSGYTPPATVIIALASITGIPESDLVARKPQKVPAG